MAFFLAGTIFHRIHLVYLEETDRMEKTSSYDFRAVEFVCVHSTLKPYATASKFAVVKSWSMNL